MYFFRDWDDGLFFRDWGDAGAFRLLELLRRQMDTDPSDDASLGRSLGGFTREDGKMVLRLDLPGVKPEDVDVTVHGRTVTVRAERKEDAPPGYKLLRRERGGTWTASRTLTLPTGAEAGDVDCRIENGILTMRFAIKPEQQPRRIAVAGGSEEVHS
jgi:HSP20 family protein